MKRTPLKGRNCLSSRMPTATATSAPREVQRDGLSEDGVRDCLAGGRVVAMPYDTPPRVVLRCGAQTLSRRRTSEAKMHRLFFPIAFAVLASCGGPPPEHAAMPHPKEAPSAAFAREQEGGERGNPRGLTFRIELRGGARYHVGERIPVTLAFSSALPKTYRLDGGLYNRIGRLDLDKYRLFPAAIDPVKDYFEWEGGMGGLRVMPVLTEKPHEMTFDLNEWARFDAPGHYELFVQSHRLSYEDAGKTKDAQATSNRVSFDIAPADAAWEEATRRAATQAFDDAKDEEARSAAAPTLRFLATPAATKDMAARMRGGPADFQLQMGLVGARDRNVAIAAMEAELPRADFPVTLSFLQTLALLHAKKDHRPDPQFVRRRSVEGALATRVAASLAAKEPAAWAMTLDALLEVAWSFPAAAPPAWLLEIAPQIGDALAKVPPEEAQQLLDYRWRRFGGPALLPALRALVDGSGTPPDLRRAALARIAALDPDFFRAKVKEIIRSGAPSLGVRAFEVVRALPDATLPELDDALATRLEACAPPARDPKCAYEDFTQAARLAARYATSAVRARIKAACPASERFAEDAGAALLAYFLRVEPAYAKVLAREVLERAKRKEGGLRVLDQASEITMTPELEAVLLDALREPAADLAASAAETLGKRGSAAAEKPLWDRLEAWHARWEGRASELRYRANEELSADTTAEIRLESALARALSQGAGWLADAAKLERLARLVVSANEEQQAASAIGNWKVARIPMSFVRSDSGDFAMGHIAQYNVASIEAATEKLAQFPAGTTFGWWGEADGDFEALRRFAEAHAMTIARETR